MSGEFDEQLRTLADRAATAARPATPTDIRRRGTRRRRVRTTGVAVAVVALVAGAFGVIEAAGDSTHSTPSVVVPLPSPPSISATPRVRPEEPPGPDRKVTLTVMPERRLIRAMTTTKNGAYEAGDLMLPSGKADPATTLWRLRPLNTPGHRYQLEALNDDGTGRGCATALAELALRLKPCRTKDANQSWRINPVVGSLQIEGIFRGDGSDDLLASYYPELSYLTVVPTDQGPVKPVP